jgi:DNA-binding CsgD family transcriptional regulator
LDLFRYIKKKPETVLYKEKNIFKKTDIMGTVRRKTALKN